MFSSGRKPKRWLYIANWALLISAFTISCVRAYQQITADLSNELFIERNYYGVVRVKLAGEDQVSTRRYLMVHGVTVHGYQFTDPTLRDAPTAYYGETGGGGLAILNSRSMARDAGGCAGTGDWHPGGVWATRDIYRFYEINPIVIQLAQGRVAFLATSRIARRRSISFPAMPAYPWSGNSTPGSRRTMTF